VHVEAVRFTVRVEDMNEQALSHVGVQDAGRNAAVPARLVEVGRDHRIQTGHRVTRIQVLAVDESVEPPTLDLRLRYTGVLVAVAPHAVAPVAVVLAILRIDGAVPRDGLDPQVHITTRHRPSSGVIEIVCSILRSDNSAS
jgi:hypothetical protein